MWKWHPSCVKVLLHVNFYASCVMDVVSWRYFRSSFLCMISSGWMWSQFLCFMCKSFLCSMYHVFFQDGDVIARCIYASCVSRIFMSLCNYFYAILRTSNASKHSFICFFVLVNMSLIIFYMLLKFSRISYLLCIYVGKWRGLKLSVIYETTCMRQHFVING